MRTEEERRIEQQHALAALMAAEQRAVATCQLAQRQLDDDQLRAQMERYESEHQERVAYLDEMVGERFMPPSRPGACEPRVGSDEEVLESVVDCERAVMQRCQLAFPVAHGPHRIRAVSLCFERAREELAWLERQAAGAATETNERTNQ